MASRTNKRGIAQKKQQLKKQAKRLKGKKRFTYPKRKLSLDQAKELGVVGAFTNPEGNTYNWFLKGRKVCRETRVTADPDGYRLIKKPSGSRELVKIELSGWMKRKIKKATQKQY